MATVDDKAGYDTSIGSKERSARSFTKLWLIVIGIVFLIGISLVVTIFNSRSSTGDAPGTGANSTSQPPGP